ncbi:hypothetical protein [Parvibaculum sp.]|uniref:hypothetical protein n=1 Tax=Parvibaculum sp. TaxID=2024848 RepID=UPI001B01A742|nr:hypothetical protein [Parvibaculum sp.]MBO6668207.1 hypothetical protein [Parvibaculum sp.]MBO6690951.1 hypothetical protein [Parvibaculum sp.]MBO6714675.1 hypothetical protein [Parvibaculum sp.]
MRFPLVVLIFAGALAGCSSGSGDPVAIPSGSAPTSSALGGTQLGLAGEGGVSESLLGVDVVSPLLGGSGLVGATTGGGKEGVLGGNVSTDALASVPVLGEVVGQLPVEGGLLPAEAQAALVDGLAQVESQVPALGVSDTGGLGEDLFGYDLTGALVGTEGGVVPGLLTGGSEAPLGNIVPEGSAPLAPVGDLARGIIEGAQADSSDGNLNALEPVISPILLGLLGAGGTGGPVEGVPLPALPLEQLNPVLEPAGAVATQVLATPLLPDGTTGTDLVFPVVFGTVAGVADATLPLGTVSDVLVTVMP